MVTFKQQNSKIEVKLCLYNATDESVGDLYKRFWINKNNLLKYFESI